MPATEVDAPDLAAEPPPRELLSAAAELLALTEPLDDKALAELDRLLAEAGLSAAGSVEAKAERLNEWYEEHLDSMAAAEQALDSVLAWLEDPEGEADKGREFCELLGLEADGELEDLRARLREFAEDSEEAEDQAEANPGGLRPKWMTVAQQPELFELGPMPCDVVDLKVASAIEGAQSALVLARKDTGDAGQAELCLAPLGLDGVPIFPVVGHRRSLVDAEPELRVSFAASTQDFQAELLAWWRGWMGAGRPLWRDDAKTNSSLDEIHYARERLRSAAAALEDAKLEAKEAKKRAEAAQESLVEAIDEAQKVPVWPWKEV